MNIQLKPRVVRMFENWPTKRILGIEGSYDETSRLATAYKATLEKLYYVWIRREKNLDSLST